MEKRLEEVTLRMGVSLHGFGHRTAHSLGELQQRPPPIDRSRKPISEKLSGECSGLQDSFETSKRAGGFGKSN